MVIVRTAKLRFKGVLGRTKRKKNNKKFSRKDIIKSLGLLYAIVCMIPMYTHKRYQFGVRRDNITPVSVIS